MAAPNRAVARFRKRGLRKLRIRSLELLERDGVGLSGPQPVEQVGEALVDIVNVEGRDFNPVRAVIAEVCVARAAWRSGTDESMVALTIKIMELINCREN